MQQMIPFILFALGFVMIIKGSDWFIDATIWVAKVLKVPNIIIGATLVSLCTTMPETMVSVNSALKGNTDIAFGNAIGSIACNTGFILGFSILLTQFKLSEKNKFTNKGYLLILLLIGLMGVGYLFGEIPRFMGLVLLTILVIYLVNNVMAIKNTPYNMEDSCVSLDKRTIIKMTFYFVIGLMFTIWGANLLVDNGVIIAKLLGVPDIVIGLTLTAVGTSLPELVTAMNAIIKKAGDLSLGNIIGANIMNILLVIGLSTSILPISISRLSIMVHLPLVIIIVCIPVFASLFKKEYFSRYIGFFMVVTYTVYVYLTFQAKL